MYTSTVYLNSALDGVGGYPHVSAALLQGVTLYSLYMRLGGPRAGLDRTAETRVHKDSIPYPSSPFASRCIDPAIPDHRNISTMHNVRI
jgi:hypothetical protein